MRSKLVSIVIATILLGITSLNIGAYQATPPLLNNIINRNNLEEAFSFVKKLAYTPFYMDQITYFSNLYGQPFIDIYHEDQNRYMVQKEKLERDLTKNPNAPPILGSLYLLSYKTGYKEEAKAYYEKAKKLDPNLTILSFEDIK
jgi:tetratricopeptide (TPR) repeat protein